jgi:hypothetical protein
LQEAKAEQDFANNKRAVEILELLLRAEIVTLEQDKM